MIVNNKSLAGWSLNGTQNTSLVNGIFTIANAVDGQNWNYMDYYMPCEPNSEIIIEFEGKIVDALKGSVILETSSDVGFTAVTVIDSYDFTDTQWTPFTLKSHVPITNTHKHMRVRFGVRWGVKGSIDLSKIKINKNTPINPKPDMIACGLIRKMSGATPDFNPDFPMYGIKTVTFNGTDTITVTLDTSSYPLKKPILSAVATADYPFVVLVGNVAGGDNASFAIRFTNGTTIQNISAIPQNIYVFIQAWL